MKTKPIFKILPFHRYDMYYAKAYSPVTGDYISTSAFVSAVRKLKGQVIVTAKAETKEEEAAVKKYYASFVELLPEEIANNIIITWR